MPNRRKASHERQHLLAIAPQAKKCEGLLIGLSLRPFPGLMKFSTSPDPRRRIPPELPISLPVGRLISNESNDTGRFAPMRQSLAALAMLALLGASVVALPYISRVEAGETAALAKGDRLEVRSDCSQQVWPNISSHCLHGDRVEAEVRLVTAVGR